jgi:hypothetical protein
MMACSRNLSKHLKICYQTKTNREMFQHDFQFFANLMIFFLKQKSNIPFSYLFFTFVHIFKPKKKEKKTSHDMCIWMFSITLSHFERITWIFAYDGCHNYFFEINYLMFNIVDYGLVTKSLGAECTFEEVAEKINCQKMNVNFLQPN